MKEEGAGPKTQLNVTIDEDLAKEIKVEAVQMGMKVSRYVELILDRRKQLVPTGEGE